MCKRFFRFFEKKLHSCNTNIVFGVIQMDAKQKSRIFAVWQVPFFDSVINK